MSLSEVIYIWALIAVNYNIPLGKSFNISVPQVFNLQGGDNIYLVYFKGFM